ncbi:hypothetical protein LCGC14_2432550 [marine sediment metagenome]|uniref:Uncharacterized protein n=1 Tax=marine sediment metagenome TaxID=412755 RepID=A0A0F9EFI0_9ZZZZ
MQPVIYEVVGMTYYTNITMWDGESSGVEFKVKNVRADKGLAEAMKFLSHKDGKSAVRRVIEFLQRDFDEFERQIRDARFPGFKNK